MATTPTGYTPTATGAQAANITEQYVREAPDIEAYKVGLLKSAQALGSAPPNLPDYKIAGMSQDQLDALGLARAGIGAYSPYLQGGAQSLTQGTRTMGEAADVLRGSDTRGQFGAAQQAMNMAANPAQQMGQYAQQAGQGYGAINAGIGSLAGAAQGYNPNSVQDYMNPFLQTVMRQGLDEINRQGAMAGLNQQAQAVKAGAFGGSREGVQRAEMARNLDQTRNQAIANMLMQGYGGAQAQSQQAFEQQQQRQMQQGQALGNMGAQYGNLAGQQANILGQQSQQLQNLGQGIGNLANQQFSQGLQTAQGLGSLGTQIGNAGVQQAALGQTAQQLGQQDVNFLYNTGAQQQKQYQSELDATRATQMQNAMQPYQNIAFVSDIYKGAPSSQMAVTQQSAATPSPFQQAAGLATGVAATAGAANKAGLL